MGGDVEEVGVERLDRRCAGVVGQCGFDVGAGAGDRLSGELFLAPGEVEVQRSLGGVRLGDDLVEPGPVEALALLQRS